MSKELFVTSNHDEIRIALLEDGKLMEIHYENADKQFGVGDLYLGKIKKLAPSLNAAFVNVGYTKDAFLHYHDLGPQVNTLQKFVQQILNGKTKSHKLGGFKNEIDTNKDGAIADVLKTGNNILIQVAKEPISTKGPRITTEISLPGRFLVLIPFSDKVSVSSKINTREEKERLKRLIESIKPEGFGVIVRTVAEEKKVAELHADLNYLENKWKQAIENLKKASPPAKVLSEIDRASSVLRDTFNDDFTKIIVDDEQLANDMRNYLSVIAPNKANIVKHQNGSVPTFERFGIEKQIKQCFGKNVNIGNSKGAYLVIEHTEALHVIDVNSGNITKTDTKREQAALNVNKLAATEIARQLRLRDMGGIVVIDFIDMPSNEHKKELYEHFKEEMRRDKAKHKILPPSRFGLIQVTRQRVRPEINIKTKEENPNTKQEVEAPVLIIDKMEYVLNNIINKHPKGKIQLHTHSFIAAYLKQGFPSIQQKWYLKYKRWVKIVPRDSYKYLQFNFLDSSKNTFYNESN